MPSEFGFTTTYTQVVEGVPQDGEIAVVKAVPRNSNVWHATAQDHSTDDGGNGYMLFVNGEFTRPEILRILLTGLTAGNQYIFSGYLANAVKSGKNYARPNVTFQIRTANDADVLLAETNSGIIPEMITLTWQQLSVTFFAASDAVIVLVTASASDGYGNDIVIDDFQLRGCLPGTPPGKHLKNRSF